MKNIWENCVNKAALVLVPGFVAVSACEKPLALSADPIERAATCGVVAAAEARKGQADFRAPLSIEAQGKILHPALVVGGETPEFSQDKAAAVVKQMSERVDAVTDSDWEKLVEPCATAFPLPAQAAALPSEPLTAALGCDALGRFMRAALASDGRYEKVLAGYNKLESSLDSKVAPLLAKRGATSSEATQLEKRKALSVFAKLGRPDQVMDACVDRYT